MPFAPRRTAVEGTPLAYPFIGHPRPKLLVPHLTDVETDWHRGVAYVGMSRARTRLHVIIHEDCDGKRREREVEWEAKGEGDVEMVL